MKYITTCILTLISLSGKCQLFEKAFLLYPRDKIENHYKGRSDIQVYERVVNSPSSYTSYNHLYTRLLFTYYFRNDTCIGYLIVRPSQGLKDVDYFNENFKRVDSIWYDVTPPIFFVLSDLLQVGISNID